MDQRKKAWIVVFSGLGVNLTLGVLYAWGVISAALIDQLEWTATQTQIPYMVASAIFAFTMVPAGRMQDKLGPRLVLLLASVLAGAGFVFSGMRLGVVELTIFFGIFFGLAMGFGYASPTPAAVKWFHSNHRGFITGLVVSGFGLAPIYIAPLANLLLDQIGIQATFITLGIFFFAIVFGFSFLIKNPPPGHVPLPLETKRKPPVRLIRQDVDYGQMLRCKQFYLIWSLFFFGTFAGLLIIGQMQKIGQEQAGMQNAFIIVTVYALFNFLGRISWGSISDHIGRKQTLFVMFAIQVLVFLLFPFLTHPFALLIGKSLVGFTFGGMLTIFPALTADLYGVKHLGVNYGLMITAWGVGGVLGPLFGGMARDITGGYDASYIAAMVLSAFGAVLSLMITLPKPTPGSKTAHARTLGEPDLSVQPPVAPENTSE